MEIVKIMNNEDKKVVINSELLSKTIHELVSLNGYYITDKIPDPEDRYKYNMSRLDVNSLIKKLITVEEEGDIVEVEDNRSCWKCKDFVLPYYCYRYSMYTAPFDECSDYVIADKDKLDKNKEGINRCCEFKSNMDTVKVELEYKFDEILNMLK